MISFEADRNRLYRIRAEQMFEKAKETATPESKCLFLLMAAQYEQLAGIAPRLLN